MPKNKTLYQAGSHYYPLQTILEVKYQPKLLNNTFSNIHFEKKWGLEAWCLNKLQCINIKFTI